MKINIFLVSPLIHYTPLYMATKELVVNGTEVKIELHHSVTDEKALSSVIKKSKNKNDNEIDLFLSSVSDIEERLDKRLNYDETRINEFFDEFVIWSAFIDRIPISILTNDKNSKKRIACYPEGSTVNWFLNKNFNHNKEYEVSEVDFNTRKEFEKLQKDDVNYAITIEPWLSPEYGVRIEHDIPIRPFGFTAIFSNISAVYNLNQREILFQLISKLNLEVEKIYEYFELNCYNTNNDSQSIREAYSVEVQSRIKEVSEGTTIFPLGYVLKGLQWMSDRRIWALDTVKSISKIQENLKSAYQIIDDLDKKEKERKKLEKFSLMSIHQLKNDLRQKIAAPLEKTSRQITNPSSREIIDTVANFSKKLSSKYENFLYAFRALNTHDKKTFNFTVYDLQKITKLISEENKEYNIIFKDYTELNSRYSVSVPKDLMQYIISGLVENAIEHYNKIHDVALEIVIGVKDFNLQSSLGLEFYVENTGSYMPSQKMKYAGLYSMESKQTSSGNFLVFLNDSLNMLRAIEIEPEMGRYFKTVNIENQSKFKISFYFKI